MLSQHETLIARLVDSTSTLSVSYFVLLNPASARSSTSSRHRTASTMSSTDEKYSIADQKARFAKAKKENNQRYLDITSIYDGSFLKGQRVAVTGANRGVGLSLATELAEQGAKVVGLCRHSSKELDDVKPDEVVTGVDVTDDKLCEWLPDKIKGGPIDIVSVAVSSFRRAECIHVCNY